MRASRRLLVCLFALAVIGLCGSGLALAAGGGGSAGDQQYTDPFAGGQTTTPSGSATHTATTPATTTPAPSTSAPTAPAATATTPPSSSTTPQTVASTTLRRLPYTGYDGWMAAGFGAAMLGAGIVLRRRTHRP